MRMALDADGNDGDGGVVVGQSHREVDLDVGLGLESTAHHERAVWMGDCDTIAGCRRRRLVGMAPMGYHACQERHAD